MATVGGTVRWIIEADDSQFNEAIDSASEKAQELKNDLDKSSSSQGGIFGTFNSQAKSAIQSLTSLSKSVLNVGWGAFSAGATTAAGALTTLIAKGIQGTDALETARTSMAGLTGSIEAGNKAISIAANFWQNNPFDRFTTTNATKQLIQYGRTLGQTQDDLELLGKISQSTSVPLDEMARYYARTAASGRAMTLDLEMMSDRGIPIYQKLSQITGKTTEQVRKMASESKISFDIFRQALEQSVNAEAMAEFENTLARQKDRLSGSISILAGDLAGYKIANDELIISANGLEKAWTRLVKTLATELRSEKMRASMEKLGYALAQILDKVTPLIPIFADKLGSALEFVANHSATLIPILGGVLTVFGKLGQGLPGIGGIIGSIGTQFSNLAKGALSLATTHPIVAGFIALFTTGFVSAIKGNDDFRKSISELVQSVGNLFKSLMPVAKTFLNIFVQLASSKAVTGTLQVVVKVLTTLANVIASLPTDVLTGFVTSLLMFKLLSISQMAGIAGGITLVVGAVSQLIDEMGGLQSIGSIIGNFWNSITSGVGNFINTLGKVGASILNALVEPFNQALKFMKSIPSSLATMGNNIMTGLVNGLVSGAKKVTTFVTDVARSIVNTFKSVLGIHSPSTVMEEQGKFITLGLANGITKNSSIVEKAMDALASSVINTASKVISAKSKFGLFNYNDEYKAWKKISQLFTKGSEQYASALEKMEEARENVNLKILDLQNTYNNTLDTTIDKLASMYGLFDEVDLSKNGKNIFDITSNLDKQVSKLQEWAAAQEGIASLDLDPKFIEELQQMGVDATDELMAIATASSEQLAQLNTLWLKKQEIASTAATKQLAGLKNDTLKEISDLKEGIDGETIDVIDVGGRLVSNIGDGITGALPTLESSFAQLNDFIAAEVAKSGESVSESLSTGDLAEDLASGIGGSLNEAMEGITASVGDVGKGLAGVIAAVIGTPILTKVLSKLKLGDKLKSLFNLGDVAKKAKDTKDTLTSVAEVGENITKSSQTLVKSGQQLTKAQSAMKTMRSGIINIILLAGAIAAMGLALKVAYESIPSDIGGLVAKLGVVAGAVTAMGVLAGLGGKFDDSIKAGLKLIAVIAGEIALTALAIATANALIPDDLGAIVPKMILIGSVIGGMELLSGIISKFDNNIVSGLKDIAIIAGEIALTGIALGIANATIPDDLGSMIGKLGVMGLAIAEFGVLAGIISAIPIDLKSGLVTIAAIAGEIALTGIALGVADQAIQSDFSTFMGKLGIMGAAITEFGVLAGVIGGLMSTGVGAIFLGAGLVALLGICAGIASTAQAIGEIDKQIPSNIDGVRSKIDLMKEAVQSMVKADFGGLFDNLKGAINIGLIADIASGFKQIGETLSLISNIQIDTATISQKVEKIKECVKILSDLQTGSFWDNLKNRNNTSIMTDTVKNIHDIVSKISECIKILQELESTFGKNQTVTGYVTTISNIVKNLAEIQTGGFWKQLDNAKAVEQINKSTGYINEIVSKVQEICNKLAGLNSDYGEGKAANLVQQAIGIMQQFSGIDLPDGGHGWFSENTYERVAKDLESVQKTSDLINKILESAKNTFDIVQNLGMDDSQAKDLVQRAVTIMSYFAGVELESGKKGWFSENTYERVAKDLENVQKVASGIEGIVNSAKNIATTIRDFSAGATSIEDYVAQANRIMEQFAKINIPQEWVEDTANKSGHLNTTAGNIGNILGAAKTIIETIQEFNSQQVDVPALVEQANKIIQELAEIKIDQDHLENTSKNAGFLNTSATNIDTILGTAKDIVDKIIEFAKIGVDQVVTYVGQANTIIEKFGELNLNGSKNYEQLASNAGHLNSAVSSVKEILDKASQMVETVRTFVKSYSPEVLEAEITSINTNLKTIAGIKVEGLGDGEEKVARLDTVKQLVDKVTEIAQAIQGVPDTAEKIANIDTIIKFIDEKLSSIPQTLQKYDESFINLGNSYAKKFGEGWSNYYDNAFENGKNMAFKYMEGIASTFNDFVKSGQDVQGQFWSGLQSKLPDEFSQGAALAVQVLDGIKSKNGEYFNVGENAVQGFINGANNRNPYSAGRQIADRFLQGLKDRGQEGSPWKTTIQSGAWAVEGLIEGIKDSEYSVVNEAQSLADAIIDTLSMDDVVINPSLDPTINPYLTETPRIATSKDYDTQSRTGRNVIIEQTNNNYTQYSIEQMNRDLAWSLSKV